MGQTENEEVIFNALEGASAGELHRKLAAILAAQDRKIEELTSRLQLLTIYEKHGGAQVPAPDKAKPDEKQAASTYASTYEVLASDYLLHADGFHAVEYGVKGLAFRWAAISGTMKFTFYVDRSRPLDIVMILFNSVDAQNYEKMRLSEGDNDIAVARADIEGQIRLTSTLPPRSNAGETNLTFHIPHVRRLAEGDARIAGVAFHKLTAAPGGAE